jgi:Fe-S-cluster-containing dehydrogenase component/formate-dependent nitrite reductase membrane component NrfD
VNYGFVIDNRKCIGCHACTVACKSEHEVPLGVNRTWVKYVEKGEYPNTRRLFSVMRCNHCTDAPCVDICPVGAMFVREDGIVDFNNERCIGCKSCTQACPYNAIYINPVNNTAAKCNYCAHRVDAGLRPACVNVCPQEAIVCGDMDDPTSDVAKLMSRQTVMARKPEKGTNPKLFYINADLASLDPLRAPPTNELIQSSQASGVGHYASKTLKRMDAKLGGMEGSTAPYENENPEDYGVQIPVGGDASVYTKNAWKVVRENARRTLDAPQKGVLWGWEVPAYLWAKSISAGAFFVSAMAALFGLAPVDNQLALVSGVTSLVFLGLTAMFLIMDLDRPDRFHYVVLRPQFSSWLVKGGNILAGFGGAVALYLAGIILNIGILSSVGQWAGLIFAVPLAGYTAFLLAQGKGRDFWQSPVLPLHMLGHSMMAGGAAIGIIGTFTGLSVYWEDLLQIVMIGAIAMNLAIVAAELLMSHPTKDAKLAAKMIYNGKFSFLFYAGTLLLGNVLPALLLVFGGMPITMLFASVFILAGIFITEYIWIRAPQLIPLS